MSDVQLPQFQIRSGVIDLGILLELVKHDDDAQGLRPRTPKNIDYSKSVKNLLAGDLLFLPGFYAWVSKETSKVIYVGKANDLHRRLTENLKHSRIALYRKVYGDNPEWKARAQIDYSKMWQVYEKNWNKAAERYEADTVIWVGSKEIGHLRLELVESQLIVEFNQYWKLINVQNTEVSDEFKNLSASSQKIIENCKQQMLLEMRKSLKDVGIVCESSMQVA